MFLFFLKAGRILIWSRNRPFELLLIFSQNHVQVEKIRNKYLWNFNLEIRNHFDIARVSRIRHRNWRKIYHEDLLPNKILKFPQLFSKGKSVVEYLGKLKHSSHESQKSMDQLKHPNSFDPMNTRNTLCFIS